jgi:hypothetical protein
MFLLLLQWSFLEMILLLFLPQHLNLFALMDINISICRSIWLKPFKIWPLYLLHFKVKVEVEVFLMLLFLQILL